MKKPRKIVVDDVEWLWTVKPTGVLFHGRKELSLGIYSKESGQYIQHKFFQGSGMVASCDFSDEIPEAITPSRIRKIILEKQL